MLTKLEHSILVVDRGQRINFITVWGKTRAFLFWCIIVWEIFGIFLILHFQ